MRRADQSSVSLSLFLGVIAAAGLARVHSADTQKEASSATETESWFQVRQVADRTLCIVDRGSDNMYLVEGDRKAILIDTGYGAARLNELVRTLTKLHLIIVNTHGHHDHAGADYQFPRVHAHPLDFEAIEAVNAMSARRQRIEQMAERIPGPDRISIEEAVNMPSAELIPVTNGHIFDLGGRTLEVIEQPGHTPGEIVLLDSSRRILFSGDNNLRVTWLFLPACRPLEVYLQSLQKLKQREGEFDTILGGHGAPSPKGLLDDQIACVESILDGSCQGASRTSIPAERRLRASTEARLSPTIRKGCGRRTDHGISSNSAGNRSQGVETSSRSRVVQRVGIGRSRSMAKDSSVQLVGFSRLAVIGFIPSAFRVLRSMVGWQAPAFDVLGQH
jgi:hydroxyacylglutathione hydrolase